MPVGGGRRSRGSGVKRGEEDSRAWRVSLSQESLSVMLLVAQCAARQKRTKPLIAAPQLSAHQSRLLSEGWSPPPPLGRTQSQSPALQYQWFAVGGVQMCDHAPNARRVQVWRAWPPAPALPCCAWSQPFLVALQLPWDNWGQRHALDNDSQSWLARKGGRSAPRSRSPAAAPEGGSTVISRFGFAPVSVRGGTERCRGTGPGRRHRRRRPRR